MIQLAHYTGWSEAAILSLPSVRFGAYLEELPRLKASLRQQAAMVRLLDPFCEQGVREFWADTDAILDDRPDQEKHDHAWARLREITPRRGAA